MIRIGPRILAEAREALESNLASVKHMKMGVVLTADGLSLVAASADLDEQEKLAAMGSAVSAMGTAVVREVHAGGCNRVTIEGSNAKILVSGLIDEPQLFLILVSDEELEMGTLLHISRRCSKAIIQAFEGPSD